MPEGIQIDTDEVDHFGRDMSRQSSGGFAHAATRGTSLHGHGVMFATSLTSPVFDEARRRYQEALQNTEANLRAYQTAAQVLAEAAEGIAKEFARADLDAEAAQTRIDAIVTNATLAVQRLQLTDEGKP
jgi:glucose-6-phosphate-specific signal transduction histidine kinase